MARHKADWSELYPEILISIAGKLETRDDFRHFRSVCKQWRSSILQIPEDLPILFPGFPHKFSHPPPNLSKYGCNPLKIVVNSTFLLQKQNPNPNAKPWLINLEELNPGKLLIRKPLRRDSIIMPADFNFPRVLDLSGYSVTEISRAYNFRGGYIPINSKVVLFFNPECETTSVNDCYALALNHRGSLLYVRFKDEDDYGSLRYSRVSCFDDIVNYRGAVWAVDRKGRAYVIPYDTTHLSLVLFANDTVCTGYVGDTRKRLVESSEGLYLIDRYHYDELIKFKVYKLNEAERKWSEIKSLDGRILFVSSDCCFFASAKDFPGCRGDCVLFPKGHFPSYYDSIYPDDFYFKGADEILEIGVFHLDNGASALISTYPGMSKIFWPPPWWLFSDTCLSGWENGEDNKEDTPEVCSSEEMCSASLAIEETKTQTTENFLGINVQELFQEVDVPWSDIPSKLLTEIAKHLNTPIDICRFRAVCKKWRTSCPPPQSSNLLSSLLPHKISTSLAPFMDMIPASTSLHSLILVASTVYLLRPSTHSVGPSKSWLVTVEEVNPGKLFLRMPLRRAAIKKLPDNFAKVWNLSDIHVSEISREYNFRYADDMFSSFNWWSFSNSHKVVLSPASACTSPTIDDTTALVLYVKGNLVSFCLRDESWLSIRYGSVTKFDDIINFNGKNYAIDRRGRAYVINCNSSTISRVVSHALGSGIGPDRRKRLVGSGGELYLLVRHSPDDKIFFRVYKLKEEQNKWDEVKTLGDKILFVTPGFCYLAFARDFPGWKGDCIVFPEACLPTNSGSTYPDGRFFKRTIEELRIGVFYLGDNDGAKLIQSYPGYSDLFWPPPAWLELAECSSRVLDRKEPEQIIIPCKHSQQEVTSPDLLENVVKEQNLDNLFTSTQREKVAESETTPPIIFSVQDSETRASTVEFQGVDVRAELVPVLQKIWDKHGNITTKSAVRDPDTVAQALESLAEAVLILKTTPWRSLDQSQADILSATLSDLQKKQFRVDWLSPFVQKVLACQKSLPLVGDLETLKQTKANIQDMKRQLAEMERITDGRIKSVVELMKALGQIDLDSFIGEGLC